MYYVGTVLYRDGRLAESREAFDRLRQEYPRHVMAYKADKAIEAIDLRLRIQGSPAEGEGQTTLEKAPPQDAPRAAGDD